jgi:cytochrome c biogenesis factor
VVHFADLEERSRIVQMLLFTALAVALYVVADRALNALEVRAGRRFEYRSLIFFVILLALAVLAFSTVQHLAPGD